MHGDDPRRLAAVRGSRLMLGQADPAFDRAARTVARATGAPVALVSVVGAARQHFAGQFGLDGDLAERRGSPISSSCCRLVVLEDGPVVASDTAQHRGISALDPIEGLVVGAYAGVPLRDGDGVTLGAVCAVAPVPRAWTDADVTVLEDVASFLQAHLTLRATTRELRGLSTDITPRRRRSAGHGCRTLPVPPRRR